MSKYAPSMPPRGLFSHGHEALCLNVLFSHGHEAMYLHMPSACPARIAAPVSRLHGRGHEEEDVIWMQLSTSVGGALGEHGPRLRISFAPETRLKIALRSP